VGNGGCAQAGSDPRSHRQHDDDGIGARKKRRAAAAFRFGTATAVATGLADGPAAAHAAKLRGKRPVHHRRALRDDADGFFRQQMLQIKRARRQCLEPFGQRLDIGLERHRDLRDTIVVSEQNGVCTIRRQRIEGAERETRLRLVLPVVEEKFAADEAEHAGIGIRQCLLQAVCRPLFRKPLQSVAGKGHAGARFGAGSGEERCHGGNQSFARMEAMRLRASSLS
jgi:hypothetical protein